LPANTNLASVQPYVMQGAAGGWLWTGSWTATSQLRAGAWNALSVTVPSNAAALAELGVEFSTASAANVNAAAYVDVVNW
jgi:hypothetical protein